jgi:hypothetical protein
MRNVADGNRSAASCSDMVKDVAVGITLAFTCGRSKQSRPARADPLVRYQGPNGLATLLVRQVQHAVRQLHGACALLTISGRSTQVPAKRSGHDIHVHDPGTIAGVVRSLMTPGPVHASHAQGVRAFGGDVLHRH